jgi:hypothetical protein|tara:strand:- start:5862 stop:6212 length:351 start_codon:yes stop_codon:yes gene_type:complete
MATQTVKIQYNGKEEFVEFEDSLTFGEVESLLSGSVDLSDVTKPKINLPFYRMKLLTLCIKKAPFKIGDETAIKMLNSKIANTILDEVLEYHPLAEYIEDWMETFQKLKDQKEPNT